jgi:hypothetical protein
VNEASAFTRLFQNTRKRGREKDSGERIRKRETDIVNR